MKCHFFEPNHLQNCIFDEDQFKRASIRMRYKRGARRQLDQKRGRNGPEQNGYAKVKKGLGFTVVLHEVVLY
jgi:hypothetical protein